MTAPRVAVVTGANRGLGLAVARGLAQRGMTVWLGARRAADAEGAAASLTADRLDARGVALDVTDLASVEAAVAAVTHGGGGVDVLVNNAAVMLPGLDEHVAGLTLATNVVGPRTLTDRLREHLTDGGHVVMVSSGLGALDAMPEPLRRRLSPQPSREMLEEMLHAYVAAVHADDLEGRGLPRSTYAMSKALLGALTRIVARELAPRGVAVNAVCPGWVQTRMGGAGAPRSLEQGAAGILWAATTPITSGPGGEPQPSGGFFRDGEPIPW